MDYLLNWFSAVGIITIIAFLWGIWLRMGEIKSEALESKMELKDRIHELDFNSLRNLRSI